MKIWTWNWENGGYNSCRAETRDDAIEQAKKLGEPKLTRWGRTHGLVPDFNSFRTISQDELNQLHARYNMD